MKLIIEIPEWKYKSICEGVEASKRCGVIGIDPDIHEAIYNGIPYEARPQGEYSRGFIDALDKAFSKFDANCTYSGDRVLQKLEKLKAEKGGAE